MFYGTDEGVLRVLDIGRPRSEIVYEGHNGPITSIVTIVVSYFFRFSLISNGFCMCVCRVCRRVNVRLLVEWTQNVVLMIRNK